MNELEVGVVLKPQGIRGEIKVKAFTDSAEDFLSLTRVFLDGIPYKILSARAAADCAYLSLRGVPDRNAAELLRGKKVTVPRDEAPELPAGSYYIADLIGCTLETEEGETLGTLTSVTPAATDIYTVLMGEREVLFPAAKGVICSVEPQNMRIVVNKTRFYEVAVL